MKKNVLALQKLPSKTHQNAGDSTEGGSRASLLLCGDSSLSVTTCN